MYRVSLIFTQVFLFSVFLCFCAEEKSAPRMNHPSSSSSSHEVDLDGVGQVMRAYKTEQGLDIFQQVFFTSLEIAGLKETRQPVLGESYPTPPSQLYRGGELWSRVKTLRQQIFSRAVVPFIQQLRLKEVCGASHPDAQAACRFGLVSIAYFGARAVNQEIGQLQQQIVDENNTYCRQATFYSLSTGRKLIFNPSSSPTSSTLLLRSAMNGSTISPPRFPGEFAFTNLNEGRANFVFARERESQAGVFDVASAAPSERFGVHLFVTGEGLPHLGIDVYSRSADAYRNTRLFSVGPVLYPYKFMESISPQSLDLSRMNAREYQALLSEAYSPQNLPHGSETIFVPNYPYFCYGGFQDETPPPPPQNFAEYSQRPRPLGGFIFLLGPSK